MMSDMVLIGICGKARTGKDTFAEFLAEELYSLSNKRYVLMAYANELKNRIQRDFDLSYDQLWGDKKEVPDTRYSKRDGSSWTPREIMQVYGEFFRGIDIDFWVNNLFNVIKDKEYGNVIITDIRHPNEAAPVSNSGGIVIKINSDRESKQSIHGATHISETAMDSYNGMDFTINNNGTIKELREQANNVAMQILNRL